MKKFTLFFFFSIFSFYTYAKVWFVTATSTGGAFNPSSLTIAFGDSVVFNITTSHNAWEVSQANYNNNVAALLPGGFQLGDGGGLVTPANLTVGTHYYVCTYHIDNGMKGFIQVNTTSVPDINSNAISLKVFPNPFAEKLNVQYHLDHRSDVQIKITDVLGNNVAVLRNEVQPPGDYLHTYDQLPLISKGHYFIDVLVDGKRTVQQLAVE